MKKDGRHVLSVNRHFEGVIAIKESIEDSMSAINNDMVKPFKKKTAFTLAETLITLTILGVVAAIMVPSIIKNNQRRMTITRLKMAYSMLDNMTQRSAIERGYPDGSTRPFNSYFKPYLNIVKNCGAGGSPIVHGCFKEKNNLPVIYDLNGNDFSNIDGGYGFTNFDKVLLKNGMGLAMYYNNETVYKYHGIIFLVDIDGPKKGDSKLGQDIFAFSYVGPAIQSNKCQFITVLPGSFDARVYGCNNITMAKVKEYCKESAASPGKPYRPGSTCATLIIKNGWKITDDYPWDWAHKKP